MSMKAMPLLFLNMAGEMVYILDQRLRAQDIDQMKAKRVLDDIMGLMCTGRFIEELFRPQPLYSAQGLRTIFSRLAHSSIMRLNKPSMDKLYDLMVMVYKYQVEQCAEPRQLLQITLNHLDQMASYATAQRVSAQIDAAYDLLVQTYSDVPVGEMQDIRYDILNFFLDYRVKVSIFLKEKCQNANGLFVINVDGPLPEGVSRPGEILIFDERGEISETVHYPCTEQFSSPQKPASLARGGHRGTRLGTNIYRSHEAEPASEATGAPLSEAGCPPPPTGQPTSPTRAAEALQLLAQLIGQSADKPCEFRLTLPGPPPLADEAGDAPAAAAVVGTRGRSDHLARVMADMTVEANAGDGGPPDLLHMLDSAVE